MNFTPSTWPWWLTPLLWSAGTILAAYIAGLALRTLVAPRLTRLVGRTRSHWDNIVVAELQRRTPWWCLLAGLWLALDFWPQLTPESAARILAHKALFALGGLSVTAMVITIASRLAALYGEMLAPGVPITGLTRNLLSILIGIIGGLVILNGLGIEITPMLTALGVGGLAVALALQEPLGNLFAGFFLAMAGHIRVGDFVRLEDGLEGYVVDFSWRSARIRQLANNLIIVPNLKLSQATVLNFHLPEQDLAVLVEAGVDYGSDLAHVERVTIDVATGVMKEVEGGVPDFAPFIRFHTFADSSINFSVILRAREFVGQFLIKHEFIKRLHARYAQEGITIPYPQRTLSARGPMPVVVETPER